MSFEFTDYQPYDFANRRHIGPTPDEMARMQALVRQAMAEGAVGLSAALIYAPDSYADTAELIALASTAAEYDGLFAAHLRSEGETFLEALEESKEQTLVSYCF